VPDPALKLAAAPVTAKDIAAAMGLSVQSAKRWWKRLRVPPTVPGVSTHRWSNRDANRLLRAWREHWHERNQIKAPK
jgi:hypothetical protein